MTQAGLCHDLDSARAGPRKHSGFRDSLGRASKTFHRSKSRKGYCSVAGRLSQNMMPSNWPEAHGAMSLGVCGVARGTSSQLVHPMASRHHVRTRGPRLGGWQPAILDFFSGSVGSTLGPGGFPAAPHLPCRGLNLLLVLNNQNDYLEWEPLSYLSQVTWRLVWPFCSDGSNWWRLVKVTWHSPTILLSLTSSPTPVSSMAIIRGPVLGFGAGAGAGASCQGRKLPVARLVGGGRPCVGSVGPQPLQLRQLLLRTRYNSNLHPAILSRPLRSCSESLFFSSTTSASVIPSKRPKMASAASFYDFKPLDSRSTSFPFVQSPVRVVLRP